MTLEEALCWCNQFEDNIILVNPQNPKKTLALQAMKQCKEALEKQTPKKPDFEGDAYDENGYLIYDTWICPCCEVRYEIYYEEYEHCPNCGQAIDWSDTE
jgi:hypothetical protein